MLSYRQTDTLIAMLCCPTGGGVVTEMTSVSYVTLCIPGYTALPAAAAAAASVLDACRITRLQ